MHLVTSYSRLIDLTCVPTSLHSKREDAQRRAHEKATLAAIQMSRQALIRVSASAGASGSGAQLAMAIEGKPAAGPVEEILQDLGLAHSGGAKPETAEGGSGAAPTEAPAPKPAATDKPVQSAGASESSARPVPELNGLLNEDGTLLNANRAIINPEKFTNYSLADGNSKAAVFRSVLGYNASNANTLLTQIRRGVTKTPASPGFVDEFGSRFRVDITVKGPNGKTAIVRTAWIYDPGSNVPRLVTLYVK